MNTEEEKKIDFPKLNFPSGSKFRVSRDAGGVLIWDALRRAWLRLTPEEWVRRHLVRHLIEVCGAPAATIRQEYPVLLGGMHQRADVVVLGSAAAGSAAPTPILLAECKAPEVELTADVFAQAVRYNTVVGARFIVITNGLRHFVHELTSEGSYLALPNFPNFPA